MSANSINSEAIASCIQENTSKKMFPQDATGIKITNLYPMRVQGLCNRMFVLSATYGLGKELFKKDFVLRISRLNSEEKISREYRVLKALKEQGLSVPEAIFMETNREIIGVPFMIMQKINGPSLSNFMNSEEKLLSAADVLAKLLSSLHQLDSKVLFNANQTESHLIGPLQFRDRKLSEIKKLVNIGYITSMAPFTRRKYLNAVTRLESTKIGNSPLTLVNCDFGPDHVLLSEKGPVIIDCEGVQLGDPAYDIGWVYHIIKLEGQFIIDHRFVKTPKPVELNYDIGEEFVNCYKKYFGSIPVNLEFYKDLVALRLAITLDLQYRPGHLSLLRSLKMRPREMLSQSILSFSVTRPFRKYCEQFLENRNILN